MNNLKMDLVSIIARAKASQEALQDEQASVAGMSRGEYLKTQEVAAQAEQTRIQRGVSLDSIDLPLSAAKRAQLITGDLRETDATGAVSAWWSLRDQHRILILAGPVGTGKTFAALDKACGTRNAIGFKASQLARRLQPINEDWPRANVRAPFIVLDDLGTESPTDFWLTHFDDFIDTRKEIGFTIITANMSAGDLRSKYSERIVSRLEEAALLLSVGSRGVRSKAGGV